MLHNPTCCEAIPKEHPARPAARLRYLIEAGCAVLMESEDLGQEVFALRMGQRLWVHVAESGRMRCILRRKFPPTGRAKRRRV